MKRLIISVALVVAAMTITIGPVAAVNASPGAKVTSSTTLDACGYFVGTSTANKTTTQSVLGPVTSYMDKGTWTGVSNNYGLGPVTSLGPVNGSYTDAYSRDSSTGTITNGTETFRSDAGQINQAFAFDPVTGWHVTVTATGSLSFLTSDTNGACYTGPFPRP